MGGVCCKEDIDFDGEGVSLYEYQYAKEKKTQMGATMSEQSTSRIFLFWGLSEREPLEKCVVSTRLEIAAL